VAKNEIEKVEYASLLHDFYGELLGDVQREVMDLYHEDDMSLSEIAEQLGQSRQGVHYTLKKAEAALEKYEEKLGLVERHIKARGLLTEAGALRDKLIGCDSVSKSAGDDIESLFKIISELAE